LINPIYFDGSVDVEQWLPITDSIIPGINKTYFVSSYGRILTTNPRYYGIMNPIYNGKGYLQITLHTDKGPKTIKMHRLVMLVFDYIPGCEFLEVNHKDCVKDNNRLDNLEWVTRSINIQHAINNGLRPVSAKGNGIMVSDNIIDALCIDYILGYSYNELADKYEIRRKTIPLLINGNNRPSVTSKYKLLGMKENKYSSK